MHYAMFAFSDRCSLWILLQIIYLILMCPNKISMLFYFLQKFDLSDLYCCAYRNIYTLNWTVLLDCFMFISRAWCLWESPRCCYGVERLIAIWSNLYWMKLHKNTQGEQKFILQRLLLMRKCTFLHLQPTMSVRSSFGISLHPCISITHFLFKFVFYMDYYLQDLYCRLPS